MKNHPIPRSHAQHRTRSHAQYRTRSHAPAWECIPHPSADLVYALPRGAWERVKERDAILENIQGLL